MTEPKPRLTGYNAAYRKKLEEEFFDSAHGSRNEKIPMWMREPISRLLREIENSRAKLAQLPEEKASDHEQLRALYDQIKRPVSGGTWQNETYNQGLWDMMKAASTICEQARLSPQKE